jgi:hypothetical protein|tara:strand:+ start:141 stop:386 length:246 start_codon:yes stop_codon:yes gene_type:complete
MTKFKVGFHMQQGYYTTVEAESKEAASEQVQKLLDAGEPVENSQQAMEEHSVVDSYQECSECLWGRIGVSCECEKDKPDTE